CRCRRTPDAVLAVAATRMFRKDGKMVRLAKKSGQVGSQSVDKNWVDIAIGADFPLSATVSAFAGLSQTAGLSDGNQTRYNVG
ncbi:hypothetical protein ONQ97_28090, partial [Salmonella enterica subsp. enterica serovar Virginia]|nr:hypothetical protein [Salmonella enterica subsp. enterica serovar Virginia]